MTATNLINTLKLAALKKWAVLIEGSPGIGKSEIVSMVALALGANLIVMHPCTSDPTDYKGFPAIVNGKAVFLTFGELEKLLTADTLTIVLLDDLGQGSPATQSALMQLVLAREINGHKISDQVVFFGATNRKTDNANVAGILSPLRSRFRTTVTLEPEFNAWKQWALNAGQPIALIAGMERTPELLNTFTPEIARAGLPFACPRTIAFLGDWLEGLRQPNETDHIEAIKRLDPEVVNGCVGEAAGVRILNNLRLFAKVGHLIPQIIQNPQIAPIPTDGGELFALCVAMGGYHITTRNADSLSTYFERVGQDSAEMRCLFWKTATIRHIDACNAGKEDKVPADKRIAKTNAYTRYAMAHPEDIQ